MSIPRCQHIKFNGLQCGSPALKDHRYCFFHNRWRDKQLNFLTGKGLHGIHSFTLPVLEDANSIQIALSQVMHLILARQIEPKISGQLLYALQTASANLRNLNFSPEPEMVVIEPRKVDQVGLGDKAWRHCEQAKPLTPEERQARLERELEDAGSNTLQKLAAMCRGGVFGKEMEEDLNRLQSSNTKSEMEN